MAAMCGNLSDTADASEDVQSICDSIKPLAEAKTGKKYEVFTAKSYRTQVLSGINYFIKVHVGGDEYVHLCVWHHSPFNGVIYEVTGIQENKSHDDKILY